MKLCWIRTYRSVYNVSCAIIILLSQLLKLFDDQVIGQCAADGFYVIMLDSDDVMVNASYANMKVRTHIQSVIQSLTVI